jgi:nickel-dependent lactate racemase
MAEIKIPTKPWYGDENLTLSFPSNWKANICNFKGFNKSAMTDKQIKEAILRPMGVKPIHELAKDRKEAVIIFDDLTRPTKVYKIVPHVLEELKKGGIFDDQIRFIVATGAHRTHTTIDFTKKLGKKIVDTYPIFNHNPYGDCTHLGITHQGIPISINSEVISCDLKIGVGCIVPHPMSGYGGGNKIILPGVASMRTIELNHYLAKDRQGKIHPSTGWAKYESNRLMQDINEAGKMAGLDIKIDAIVNLNRDATDLIVGDPLIEHKEGVKLAREHYSTKIVENSDIVVANAYCKANEAGLAINIAMQSLKKQGGDLVIIANTPEGQVPHYLYGRFGKTKIGGCSWVEKTSLPPRVNKLFVMTEYPDRAGSWWFGPPDSITWVKTWDEVLEELSINEEKRVAVYPDATIQSSEAQLLK